jgi:hypothetical protein
MSRPEQPPAFDTTVGQWRAAEHHVKAAFRRCRKTPNTVNRLALTASWLALGLAVNEVCKGATRHPSRMSASSAAIAFASWEDLHHQLERKRLLDWTK